VKDKEMMKLLVISILSLVALSAQQMPTCDEYEYIGSPAVVVNSTWEFGAQITIPFHFNKEVNLKDVIMVEIDLMPHVKSVGHPWGLHCGKFQYFALGSKLFIWDCTLYNNVSRKMEITFNVDSTEKTFDYKKMAVKGMKQCLLSSKDKVAPTPAPTPKPTRKVESLTVPHPMGIVKIVSRKTVVLKEWPGLSGAQLEVMGAKFKVGDGFYFFMQKESDLLVQGDVWGLPTSTIKVDDHSASTSVHGIIEYGQPLNKFVFKVNVNLQEGVTRPVKASDFIVLIAAKL